MSDRTKQVEQIAGVTILALLTIGSIVIVLPFLPAILWAVVFTVTIWPFFTKVEKALGGRTSLAAVVCTLLLALIFFLPLVYVGSKLVSQASIAFDYTQGLMEKGLGPPPLWLKALPLVGERLEGIWQGIGRDTPRLIGMVKPHIKNILSYIVGAGAGMARIFLLTILSLIFFLFLLGGRGGAGTTLLAMAQGEFTDALVATEAKTMLRQLIRYHLDGKPLNTRRILLDLHEL